jgi:hypothetical protein
MVVGLYLLGLFCGKLRGMIKMSANGVDFEWQYYTGDACTMPQDRRRRIYVATRGGIEPKHSYQVTSLIWDWNGSQYDVVKWRYVEDEVERKKRLERENV